MQAMFDSTFFPADMSPWIANLIILFLKGVVVLSATWLMAYALRGSAAAIRFMVWCTGLLSLMLLPLLSSVLPAWQLEMLTFTPAETTSPVFAGLPAPPDAMAWEAAAPAPFPTPFPSADGVGMTPPPAPAAEVPALATDAPAPAADASFLSGFDYHWTTWAFLIWTMGVFVAAVRLLLAHAGAIMLVRRSEIMHDEDWHLLAERITNRLEIDRFVRLRKSSWTSVPMSVGIWRPTIVLPEDADEWDENQRRTVLYHELAHVKRKDCLLQLLTQVTCALYWFNPLVWVAVWQLRIERERACDDLVLSSGVNPSKYAETLLHTARQIRNAEWSTLATVSMARQSQLEGRLLSILDSGRRRSLNKATIVLTISMIACMVIPLAVLQPAQAQKAPRIVAVAPSPVIVDVPTVYVPEINIPEIVVPEIEMPEITIPEIAIPEINVPEIVIPEINIPEFHFEMPPVHIPDIEIPEFEWGEELEADTPVDSLTIDQIIQLRKYGVDAEFIQSIKALGFQDLTYNDLVRLGKYGADADYIGEMRDAGFDGLSLSDYANMRKYGVNPEFMASMNRAGYTDLSADDLIAMSKYGVDQRLVDVLRENGYDDIDVEDLVAASKYGVSEELISSLAAAGYNNFSIEELIAASKYGVDEELIASMREYGYREVSPDDLISASKHGVDERLMNSLAEFGYDGIPLEDVIAMKKYGVDARYLAEMSETGLTYDVDELISMRKHGVDAQYIKDVKAAGIEDVSAEQLIEMRKHGVDAEFIRSLRDN